ncbi:MAG: ExbD/TolR family protein [Candidatus Polarisedimenticolia bacterium]
MQLNGGGPSGLQSEINITPLVDVVLVLLIIFMVVVPLAMLGHDLDVPRVSAEAAPQQLEEEPQIVLSIGSASCGILQPPQGDGLPADCRVSLAETEISAAELPARVGEILGGRPRDQRVLFLAADDVLNYEGVLRIVDLAKTGVDELTIEVITAN